MDGNEDYWEEDVPLKWYDDWQNIVIKQTIKLMAVAVGFFTRRPFLMRYNEFLLNQKFVKSSINWAVRRAIRSLNWVMYYLEKYLRISLEDIIIRLLRRPGLRKNMLNLLTMLNPVIWRLEPEVLWVFREFLRTDGIKEDILPLLFSIGPIFDVFVEPGVVERAFGS